MPNSTIHFMDGTTNGELAGHGVQTTSVAFAIPASLTVNGVQYDFCFADIAHGGTHTFGAPPNVPAGGIAYLWYAPAELLWDNGPGAPNAWFAAYDGSKQGHSTILVPLDIQQGGQQIPLISGWWTMGYVHTDGAATRAIAPVSAPHGTQIKGWANSWVVSSRPATCSFRTHWTSPRDGPAVAWRSIGSCHLPCW